jgi:hypothetical protein
MPHDEECEDGQDEATVRPVSLSMSLDSVEVMCVAKASFRLADGTAMDGFLSPGGSYDTDLGHLQPAILTECGQISFLRIRSRQAGVCHQCLEGEGAGRRCTCPRDRSLYADVLAVAGGVWIAAGGSIKIRPGWADCKEFLRLQDSWTKGGKYREVPITTAQQRAVLDAAKALAGKGSLIPPGMRYRDQLNRFRAQCDNAWSA